MMATPVNQAKRRATDEKHLDWLRRWVRGETMTDIAHQWGVTRAAVSLAIKDIMVADIAESGDPGVALAYRGKK